MMTNRTTLWMALAVLGCLCGCEKRTERVNAPPQGTSDRPNDMQEFYSYMVDNGMLWEMCVADVHFQPHTAKLNGLGKRQLNRMAELLQDHGGEIHYETQSRNDPLIEARIGEITDYLVHAGLAADKFDVVAGMAAGRGLRAQEAIKILHNGTNKSAGEEKEKQGIMTRG